MSLPPELLEKLRQTGIRIDGAGRLWHENGEVTHAGLRRAILCWLDVLEDGRPIIRLDETRYAYVEVDDAHLQVLSARLRGPEIRIATNDGNEECLDPTTLEVGRDHALYCRVRKGKLVARLSSAAFQTLAPHIVEDEDGFALQWQNQRFAIANRN